MRALVVVAHPLGDSLCAHFAAIARHALEAGGHSVETIDLHAEDFDPRLTADERRAYYADRPDASGVPRHADALTRCEALVLVFPIWWFGPPAILKGWVDRVFAPGIAFDHGRNFGPITPRLTELRHVALVTTLGSPWWIDLFVMRRPVRRVFKTAIIGGCAPHARVTYLPFHSAERPAPGRVKAHEHRLRAHFSRWG